MSQSKKCWEVSLVFSQVQGDLYEEDDTFDGWLQLDSTSGRLKLDPSQTAKNYDFSLHEKNGTWAGRSLTGATVTLRELKIDEWEGHFSERVEFHGGGAQTHSARILVSGVRVECGADFAR